MAEVPEWARAAIRDECRRANLRQPEVTWRNGTRGYTTGHYRTTRRGSITITASGSHTEQLGVLLHEIAHHIAAHRRKPRSTHRWHGRHFIRVVRRLYTRHGILGGGKLRIREYATVKRALLAQNMAQNPELTLDEMLANVAAFIMQVEARRATQT